MDKGGGVGPKINLRNSVSDPYHFDLDPDPR